MKTLFCLVVLTLAMSACAKANTGSESAPPPPANAADKIPGAGRDCPVRFSSSGQCAQMTWEVIPTEETKGSFLLHLISAPSSQTPKLSVQLRMPGMEHHSPFVKVAQLDDSTFRVSGVYFVMPGHWEIVFNLLIADGSSRVDEAVMPYEAHD